MKTKVKIWHQSFDMDKLESISRYHETSIDIPVSSGMQEKMMNIAIAGEKDFDEELKRCLKLDDWRTTSEISKVLKANGSAGAFRVLFEIPVLPNMVYVYQNIVGPQAYGKFVVEDELEVI